jgi:serine/threonine protein phosphatase PrpC
MSEVSETKTTDQQSLQFTYKTEASGKENQDRVESFETNGIWVGIVADGAGGTGGGAEAASLLTQELRATIESSPQEKLSSQQLQQVLVELDQTLVRNVHAGETTVVVAICSDNVVYGASVGDSCAWLVDTDANVDDLTHQQHRKPLLGTGQASPVGFGPIPLRGTLVLASDGLTKYCSRKKLTSAIATENWNDLPEQLLNLVRLPSGQLQDDTSFLLCRNVVADAQ